MKSPISLKGYLSLHFGLAAVLSMILFASLLWFFTMPDIKEGMEIQDQVIARSTAAHISGYLKGGEHQSTSLDEFISQLPMEPVFFAMVLDSRGQILADSRNRYRGKTLDIDLPAGKGAPTLSFELDGEKMQGLCVALEDEALNVLVAQPAPPPFYPFRSIVPLFALGLIVALGLAGFISRHIALRFTALLGSYAKNADSIAGGCYDPEWPKGDTREFSLLGKSLEGMAEKIRLREKAKGDGQRQLENLTQFCFDHAAVGIYHIGDGGRILNANESAAKMLGYSTAELCRLSIPDINPFTELDLMEAKRKKLVTEGKDTFEVNHMKKDGSVVPVEISSTLLEYDGRQFAICFAQDITERKRMEKALKESRERLDLAMSGANDGIWDWHIKENEVYFDARYYTIAGYNPDEFPNAFEEFKNRVHPKDLGRVESAIARYLAGDLNAYNAEFRFLRRDGSFMSILARGKIVARDDQGNPSRFIGTHTDITQRKQFEEELRQLRNYLSNIINSMPSIMVAVDREGKVTLLNNQAEQASGLPFAQAVGQPLTRVFPGLTGEMGRIETAVKEGRVINSPKVSRKLKQETRFETITIFPLVANGAEGAVIRVDDITEQVRMEEMMIQSEKMLSVGGLAAGMAHEINNPMAGMIQTAQVMQRRLGAGADIPANRKAAEAAGTTMEAIETYMADRGIPRMIEAITESGRRVAEIVNNMLSFARKDESAISSHCLAEIFDRTLELAAIDFDLKKSYDFRQIKIVRSFADNLPVIPCQVSKIQQVILNILTNGAQAMHNAGTKHPQFFVRIYADAEYGLACMEIKDNGPGMDETTCKHVFDPFFTTKPVGLGTGLGLSVSYFIITENHRGDMAVESRPDMGAKFIIRLPLKGVDPHFHPPPISN